MNENQICRKEIQIDFLGDISIADWEADSCTAVAIAEKINACLEEADYRIANFESPVVFSENAEPIDKSGPNLKTDEKYIPFYETLHIDGYTLANNHLGDYGLPGITDTLHVLEGLKKDYVGLTFGNEKLYKPLRKEIRGFRIAIFSICENEFGTGHGGQIGAAGYDREIVRKSIEKEVGHTDYTIVIFHGGAEYNPFPSPEQKLRYRELIEFGADAVIGMHPHCPQGYERYQNKIIIYSTGNFFFPEACETPFPTWTIGYIARLHFDQKEVGFDLIPYKFDIYGKDFTLIERSEFAEYLNKISEAIQDDEKLQKLYKAWACMSGRMYFERMCGGIQNLEDRRKLALVKNMFSCEAHNELMRTYLKLLFDNEVEKYSEYERRIKYYMNFPLKKIVESDSQANSIAGKDAAIWGISKKAELLYREMQKKGKKVVFVDKNPLKQGMFFMGERIISPEEIMCCRQDIEIYLCMSAKAAAEVQEFLRSHKRTNIIMAAEGRL